MQDRTIEHSLSTTLSLPPASGAWREGDEPGRRQWVSLPAPLPLEAGGELPGVRIAYETWGTLDADASNAVLVLHALTGDSHLAGPTGPGHPTPGWWDALVGPGRALDPARLVRGGAERGRRLPGQHRAVVDRAGRAVRGAAGSRWSRSGTRSRPRSCWPTRWGSRAGPAWWAARWAGCGRWSGRRPSRTGCAGCSCWPARPRRRPTRSAGRRRSWPRSAATRAGAAATTTPRRPGRGPHLGLGIARRMAHLSYRSPFELATRFGRRAPARRGPAARRPLRGGVLPGPPRGEAGAPLRRRRPTCG